LFSSSFLLNDIWWGRQPSTVSQYCYAVRRFFGYCAVFEDNFALPIDSVLAARYLSFLKQSNCTVGAVKTAFNALKWLHNFVPNINKFNDPLDDKIVKGVFDSALRSLRSKKNTKKPLSVDIVSMILESSFVDSSLLNLRNCLIISLAFSLLLRHDEISHMACSHISFCKGGLKFLIPSSKTDVLRNGKNVFLAQDAGRKSVFSLFFKYLKAAKLNLGEDRFLFGQISFNRISQCKEILNSKLSYSAYRKILRDKVQSCGFSPDSYGFHSCRSGGATSLASSVTQFELLSAGRWKDPRSLNHYVAIPDSRRMDMSKKLFIT
jgi:hypothetical protein